MWKATILIFTPQRIESPHACHVTAAHLVLYGAFFIILIGQGEKVEKMEAERNVQNSCFVPWTVLSNPKWPLCFCKNLQVLFCFYHLVFSVLLFVSYPIFVQDTHLLLTGGIEKVLRIFDLNHPDAPPIEVDKSPGSIRTVAWLHSDQTILSSCTDIGGVRYVSIASLILPHYLIFFLSECIQN